jgi:hypothetical protein
LQNITVVKKIGGTKIGYPSEFESVLKVAFTQKGLMRLSFLQTDEPDYFPELEF